MGRVVGNDGEEGEGEVKGKNAFKVCVIGKCDIVALILCMYLSDSYTVIIHKMLHAGVCCS